MDTRRTRHKEFTSRNRKLQPTYLLMMQCLLYSRVDTGILSKKDHYDEDVNIYLAQLLNSFITPEYVERVRRSLSKYDTEVFRRLSTSTDAKVKYTIYKTSADFLLVSVGIFDNPSAILAKANTKSQPSEEASIGRGKSYYHFAYSFSQQVHKKNPAVSEVLEKLSVGFDRYARILSHLRGEYVDIMKRLSKGEIYHLERTVDAEGRKDLLKQKQNLLLDVYSEWKKTGAPHLQVRLNQIVEDIRTLDPSFNFTIIDDSG
ncbi:MAG: hypothetical protein AMJ46_03015 [Latescibacteria bacterium DG_63]|nr:MAG: hypothetical protein AMJ46_03015 [Latescibacteria bacterium DG_63]